MIYPKYSDLNKTICKLAEYGDLKCEYGCSKAVSEIVEKITHEAKVALGLIRELEEDSVMKEKEPDELPKIQALRLDGPRVLCSEMDSERLKDKLWGAILGRFAGCTLGVPVESWSIEEMQGLALATKTPFPPTEYWHDVTNRFQPQYQKSLRSAYTKDSMDGVPVDDDITYTLLDLLILEEYGLNLTTEQVGKAWKKYLPCACTAEKAALDNLNKDRKSVV